MRSLLVVACSVFLLTPFRGSAAELPKVSFEQKIKGSWIVDNAPNRLLSRLVVSRDDGGWWLEVWAVRGLREEAVQKVSLHLLHSGTRAEDPVVRGLAVWKEGVGDGEATMYAVLRAEGAGLVFDLSRIYRTPRYPSWSSVYPLKKAAAIER